MNKTLEAFDKIISVNQSETKDKTRGAYRYD